MSTAASDRIPATATLDARTRFLDVDRAKRYLRLPHDASPATDSPAKMATASGIRNSSNAFKAIAAMVKPDELGITEP